MLKPGGIRDGPKDNSYWCFSEVRTDSMSARRRLRRGSLARRASSRRICRPTAAPVFIPHTIPLHALAQLVNEPLPLRIVTKQTNRGIHPTPRFPCMSGLPHGNVIDRSCVFNSWHPWHATILPHTSVISKLLSLGPSPRPSAQRNQSDRRLRPAWI